MFIFDGATFVIFLIIFISIYGILEIWDNENCKTIQAKGGVSVAIAVVLTLIYSYFIASGTEELLTDNFVDAGTKFNSVSGIDNIRSMADI